MQRGGRCAAPPRCAGVAALLHVQGCTYSNLSYARPNPSIAQESLHYFKYKAAENVLYEFADDVAPRHITAALPLDYDTVAAADKFCNVFLTRLPAEVSGQARRRPFSKLKATSELWLPWCA